MKFAGISILIFVLIFILNGCGDSITQTDSSLKLSFINTSSEKLNDLVVADVNIGDLYPDGVSDKIKFESFMFDTGMPDENASARVNGKLYTNYYRGYWCGTEKLKAETGQYIIEVSIVDTVLTMYCKNGPTIFD